MPFFLSCSTESERRRYRRRLFLQSVARVERAIMLPGDAGTSRARIKEFLSDPSRFGGLLLFRLGNGLRQSGSEHGSQLSKGSP